MKAGCQTRSFSPISLLQIFWGILPAKFTTYFRLQFPRLATKTTNFPPSADLLQSCIPPSNFLLSRIPAAKRGSSRILPTFCLNLYKMRYNVECFFFFQISDGHQVSSVPFAECFRDHCQVGTLLTSSPRLPVVRYTPPWVKRSEVTLAVLKMSSMHVSFDNRN